MGERTAHPERAIDVFLADDNLIVRALIERHAELRSVADAQGELGRGMSLTVGARRP